MGFPRLFCSICRLGWTCVLGFNVRLFICISWLSIKTIIKVVESCETWQICANQVYLTFQPLLSM